MKKALDKIPLFGIIISVRWRGQIQRVCVKVAQQTLTLYVRVRILHPLPKTPWYGKVPGCFSVKPSEGFEPSLFQSVRCFAEQAGNGAKRRSNPSAAAKRNTLVRFVPVCFFYVSHRGIQTLRWPARCFLDFNPALMKGIWSCSTLWIIFIPQESKKFCFPPDLCFSTLLSLERNPCTCLLLMLTVLSFPIAPSLLLVRQNTDNQRWPVPNKNSNK